MLTCIYTLQFTQFVPILFSAKKKNYNSFVVLLTIGSIAFFDSNIVCNYHVGWCDITIQFAAFTPYILPFFVCLVHSFFWFQYNLPVSRGLMWYHVNPHFCYYLYFLLSKNVIIFFLYLNYRCITFQFVPIISFFIFEPVYINYICMIYFH